MNLLSTVKQNNLSFQLGPISLRDLVGLSEAPCDLYGHINGLFQRLVAKNDDLDRQRFTRLIEQNVDRLFVAAENLPTIRELHRQELIKKSRSLSVGDVQSNIKKQSNLLLLGLNQLYLNPLDDDLLQSEHQGLRNLGQVLIGQEMHMTKQLFQNLKKQRHHYSIAHPLMSSLFLLEYLKSTGQYSAKEIEDLFVTNYFKDLGLSALDQESLDKSKLSKEEREKINNHQQFSAEILSNRLPLGENAFNIIRHHHLHPETHPEMIIGLDTLLVNSVDSFMAMIHERPYREALSHYAALKHIKELLGSEHNAEFKLLIHLVQKFFQ